MPTNQLFSARYIGHDFLPLPGFDKSLKTDLFPPNNYTVLRISQHNYTTVFLIDVTNLSLQRSIIPIATHIITVNISQVTDTHQ